ncbi:hypothetical protein COO72_00085 [Bifidobacterium callitrichos]|nr:hypothetical protein COO72_00085 [Bifidobacterium callitrichos]
MANREGAAGQRDRKTMQLTAESRKRIRDLRAAIARTLARIDEIRQQEIPQIKADYATKIGVWRTRLIKAELAVRRAKRRNALARMSTNQGKPVDTEAVTKQLDVEFFQWQRRIARETRQLNDLLRWHSGMRPMGPAKSKELNRLFRKLARRFHPDLFPGDEERADYYAMAQNALAHGDLELMRALDVATVDMVDDVDYSRLTVDELETECELLEDRLKACTTRLDKLTSTEPYTLRARLADTEWVSATVNALRTRVETCEREQGRYDEIYERLAKGDRDQ